MKDRTREGKKHTSFKKKDAKANFDIFENQGQGNKKPRPHKSYQQKPKPLISKAERNQMLRDLCVKKGKKNER